jgi:hypothetical protein
MISGAQAEKSGLQRSVEGFQSVLGTEVHDTQEGS